MTPTKREPISRWARRRQSAFRSTASWTDSRSGFAFNLDFSTGVLVFIAVAAHDFADGLNMVSFVLSQSGDRGAAMRWLRIDALAPLVGAIVGASLSVSESFLGHALAIYGGFFIYLGATDLLPEAHSHASWARVGLTVAGFAADLRDHPDRRRLSEPFRRPLGPVFRGLP